MSNRKLPGWVYPVGALGSALLLASFVLATGGSVGALFALVVLGGAVYWVSGKWLLGSPSRQLDVVEAVRIAPRTASVSDLAQLHEPQLDDRAREFRESSSARAVIALPSCGLVAFNEPYRVLFPHPDLPSEAIDLKDAVRSYRPGAPVRCVCSLVRKVQAVIEERHCSLEKAFWDWKRRGSPEELDLKPDLEFLEIEAAPKEAWYRGVRLGMRPLIPVLSAENSRVEFLVEVTFHEQLRGLFRIVEKDRTARRVEAHLTFIGDDTAVRSFGPSKIEVDSRRKGAEKLFALQDQLRGLIADLEVGLSEDHVRARLDDLRAERQGYSTGEILTDIIRAKRFSSLKECLEVHSNRLVDAFLLEKFYEQVSSSDVENPPRAFREILSSREQEEEKNRIRVSLHS